MKKAFIQTFGCQMNEHDSQKMKEILSSQGYEITDLVEQAGLVLVNTCSVRENPENKVYSLLGRLSRLKKKNPKMIIGVGGCVAQQEGEALLKREKTVDMVFGTDNFFRLPQMIQTVEAGGRVVMTNWSPREKKIQNFIPQTELENSRVEGCKAMIAITKGCDNFCSFCIVPATRGRLVCREMENIVTEARDLIAKGAKEIQLLGQNVNSYQARENDFLTLLKTIAGLKGLLRLRFTSPHPNDWDEDLSRLMATNPVICNQIHLPFQSGSNRILKLMRRGHDIETFLNKIDQLKKLIPNIAFGTDVIVGYPGETEDEFEATLAVIEQVRFQNIYAFKYSPRPGTKAAAEPDDVPVETKQKRLSTLLDAQARIQTELLEELVGSTQSVLIDSAHPKERGTMNGRTDQNIPVAVADLDLEIGDLIEVEITGKKTHSLVGSNRGKLEI